MYNFQEASLENKEVKIISSIPKSDLYGLLICAAVKGDIKIIKECLRRDLDVSYDGHVAIRLASQKGHLNVVEYLVENGSDVEYAKIYGTKEVKEWAKNYQPVYVNTGFAILK